METSGSRFFFVLSSEGTVGLYSVMCALLFVFYAGFGRVYGCGAFFKTCGLGEEGGDS